MTFVLTELPYEQDALEPYISARTMELHYGKHHKGYVDKLNDAINGTKYENMSLDEVIRASYDNQDTDVFNNAAQSWNHTFFWDCMRPGGGGAPGGPLSDRIEQQFGGISEFRRQFKEAATGQFGSGWAWLATDENGLSIVSTSDANSPLTWNAAPLLTLDVWEHAYYLDYQNSRDKFVDAFLENLINWGFAQTNLETFDRGR